MSFQLKVVSVDDFDTDWNRRKTYDLIHGRPLAACSADYNRLFQQCFESLRPGRWLEMQDIGLPIACDDGTANDTQFAKWNSLFIDAFVQIGRDASCAPKYKDWMIAAGFESVVEMQFKWPINSWPKDKRRKEVGRWNMVNMMEGLDGFSFRMFNKVLGMTT